MRACGKVANGKRWVLNHGVVWDVHSFSVENPCSDRTGGTPPALVLFYPRGSERRVSRTPRSSGRLPSPRSRSHIDCCNSLHRTRKCRLGMDGNRSVGGRSEHPPCLLPTGGGVSRRQDLFRSRRPDRSMNRHMHSGISHLVLRRRNGLMRDVQHAGGSYECAQ